MNVTDDMWTAYRLCHPDHEGLSIKEAAKKMGVSFWEVRGMLRAMQFFHSDLFADIRHPDHNTVRYRPWADGCTKRKF